MRPILIVSVLTLIAALPTRAPAQALLHELYGNQVFETLGFSIDGAGDVNADGFADFVVGSPDKNNGGVSAAGAAFVYSGVDAAVLYSFMGAAQNEHFGHAVAGAGDVDADGYDDILAGTPFNNLNGSRSGIARVFSGLDGSMLYEFRGAASDYELGWTLAGLGDVNVDGHDDIVVGVPHGGLNGQALVYSGLDGSVLHTLTGDGGAEGFAYSLDGAGDVDADGRPDIVVGLTSTQVQKVRVFSGLDGTTLYTFDRPYEECWMWGYSVSGAGDVDADGHADIVVGAYRDSLVFTESGMARVLSGADGSTLHTFYGWWPNDRFGFDVDGAGDVDDDGFDDIVAGSALATGLGGAQAGRLVVFSGQNGSMLRDFSPHWFQPNDFLGKAVSGLGDVNGDGFDDIAGGAWSNDQGGNSAGAVLVYSLRYTVRELDPPEVVFNAPTTVSLLGSGFERDSPIGVKFGGAPATSVTWISSERVDCVTPGDGVQNTLVDVTFEQAGLSVLTHNGMKYAGTDVVEVWPNQGPIIGGDEVIIYGNNFVDDGSAVVLFENAYAGTILEIDEPNLIIVSTPPVPTEIGPGVTVTTSAGTDTLGFSYSFKNRWVYPHTGNITGGEIVTMYGDVQISPVDDMSATIGTLPAQIVSLAPGMVEILTPSVEAATGELLNVRLSSPTIGDQVVPGTFMYTPYAAATKSGSVFTGMKLAVSVRSSSKAPQSTKVTLWTIDPTLPPPPNQFTTGLTAGLSAPGGIPGGVLGGSPTPPVQLSGNAPPLLRPPVGPAGTLYGAPLDILVANVPLPILATSLELELGQMSPLLIGTTVYFQGYVTGEGSSAGTYTNLMSFVIQ
ncbi:MAG TPA: IPT/TIG domain-containing protein [Planctomycetota bacterium]|nr:IPT/TIG domain-containing protein [Planctomycetota bacterium]